MGNLPTGNLRKKSHAQKFKLSQNFTFGKAARFSSQRSIHLAARKEAIASCVN
jgi:hypothetical protein